MVWLNRNRSFYEYKIREAQGKTVVAKKDVLQCRDALKAKHSKNQEVSTRKWKPSSSNWRGALEADCVEGKGDPEDGEKSSTIGGGYPNWYNDELSARGFTGLEADWKTWAHSLKYFQVDLDKMEIIQLDPEIDLRASPVSDGSRCNSLLLCRFMSWDLLTMVITMGPVRPYSFAFSFVLN
ncbi:hypothetical protein F2Q70_00015369 [Brassica cretica]|uniref:Uncharacterized protein n=1 Tax=Brassica cretica TaxID=69181 RepID=A0A8S9HW49_BRACR|nr:hypothetical protein F2Q70_00015369 [Brassica cretica]